MWLDLIMFLVLIVGAVPMGLEYFRSRELSQSVLKRFIVFVAGVFALRTALPIFSVLYTERLLFGDMGNYASVNAKYVVRDVFLFVLGGLLTYGFLGFWMRLVAKSAKPLPEEKEPEHDPRAQPWTREYREHNRGYNALKSWSQTEIWIRRVGGLVQFAVAVVFGLVAMRSWRTVTLFLNQVPFGRVDPVHGKDIAFYVVSLKFWGLIRDWTTALIAITGISVVVLHYFHYMRAEEVFGKEEAAGHFDKAVDHLTILLGLFLMTRVFNNLFIQPYQILVQGNSSAVPAGAGYVDVNLRIPLFRTKALLLGVASLLLFADAFLLKGKTLVDLFVSFFKRHFRLALVATVVIGIFLGWYFEFSPMWVQGRLVGPAGPKMEAEYIRHHIEMTRSAYALDKAVEGEFAYSPGLSQEEYRANDPTLSQARVMDWRIGLEHAGSYEESQTYFNFGDVDIDRYFGKEYMLAARELEIKSLGKADRTWSNLHLQYTHGEGYVIFEVSKTDSKGEPEYVVRNLPLVGPERLVARNSAIYFGESTDQWVIVNTGLEEVGTTGNYEGGAGIQLSPLNRLMFAMRLNDWDLLVSGVINPQSRILFRREIGARVKSLAPFLGYDTDPYFVVDQDKLYWVIDAFTFADGYPYAAKTKGVIRQDGQASLKVDCNYVRNSVKVVVDAYEGDVSFFIVDQEDPVIRSWAKAFPELFRPMAEMPEIVKTHLRYAEDLFLIQAEKLERYHRYSVEDEVVDQSKVDPLVTAFYTGENVWDSPHENYRDTTQEVEPRHVWMRLPGQEENEFALILPFARKNSENLIAWLAGRSDIEHYGELNILSFPRGMTVVGPMQAESSVKTDPKYTKELTLWSSQTSKVFWGNIITLPVLGEKSGSVVYVIPIYIQDQKSNIPKLGSVALYADGRIIFKPTLQEALEELYGQKMSEIPSLTEGDDLAANAFAYYLKAQECAGVGDWECFGQQMKLLGEVLLQLESQK